MIYKFSPRFILEILSRHYATKALARKKQSIVREYAIGFSLSTLIETGTFYGDMVNAMCHHFEHIWSIELDQRLFQKARRRFRWQRHVSILQGDSGKVLPDILTSVKEPSLFWLDGHYSGGKTARSELETPIRKELIPILEHPVEGHVILIDDARSFDGSHDYPTIEALEKLIKGIRPSWVVDVRDDIIRAHKPI